MHAFAARLKRIAASLEQKGVLAPDTGLMTQRAFMGELQRAAETPPNAAPACRSRGSPSNDLDRRASLDAARITGRLLRERFRLPRGTARS